MGHQSWPGALLKISNSHMVCSTPMNIRWYYYFDWGRRYYRVRFPAIQVWVGSGVIIPVGSIRLQIRLFPQPFSLPWTKKMHQYKFSCYWGSRVIFLIRIPMLCRQREIPQKALNYDIFVLEVGVLLISKLTKNLLIAEYIWWANFHYHKSKIPLTLN